MQELICSLTALVVGSLRLLLVRARTNLRMDHNLVVGHAFCLCLIEGCEEELSEDLTDQVFLLNDPVADCFVSLGDNLARQ